MIRRLLLVLAAAVGLVMMPLAANAYEAPGYTFTVSDASPGVGQEFPVTFTSPVKSVQPYTLTITSAGVPDSAIEIRGSKALTKSSDAAGVTTWFVTLTEAGTYSMTATNAAGAVLGTQVVTVHAISAAGLPGVPQLSKTGYNPTLALAAGALLVVGSGALVLVRRRKTTTSI